MCRAWPSFPQPSSFVQPCPSPPFLPCSASPSLSPFFPPCPCPSSHPFSAPPFSLPPSFGQLGPSSPFLPCSASPSLGPFFPPCPYPSSQTLTLRLTLTQPLTLTLTLGGAAARHPTVRLHRAAAARAVGATPARVGTAPSASQDRRGRCEGARGHCACDAAGAAARTPLQRPYLRLTKLYL